MSLSLHAALDRISQKAVARGVAKVMREKRRQQNRMSPFNDPIADQGRMHPAAIQSLANCEAVVVP
ncbi:hypothetical protein ACIF2S_02215 [Pseudomonas taetrolens]|uniref:hypothetical protein n=1 Tax=Pseudomonas taetrolens TaxID=47884 RepID=UPI0037C66181